MAEFDTTDDERQLREELKWAREVLSIKENGGEHVGVNSAHARQIPMRYRARFLEISSTELQDHVGRLESDLEDLRGGFV